MDQLRKNEEHMVRFTPDGHLVNCWDVNYYSRMLKKEFKTKEGERPYKVVKREVLYEAADE